MLVTVCENIGITFSRAVVMYIRFYWEPRTRKHCFFASFLHKIDRTAANQIRCRGQILCHDAQKNEEEEEEEGQDDLLCFFFCSKDSSTKKVLKKRKKGKKTLTFEENWEKKKTRQSAVCRTKRRRSSAQHARTFSRSEPSVTMFTLSTSATVSSVRASRLLCVSAFSNRMAAMSPLAYVFLLARKPEGGEISFVSLAREGKGTRCDGFLGKKELELCGEKTLSCSLQVFCPVRSP